MKRDVSQKMITESLKNTALMMTVSCVRNTIIEDYHAGIVPQSKTGDYSDVKVVTPFGEIPWNELSRINDREMKKFNVDVVDRIYTYLEFLLNPHITDDEKEEFMKFCRYTFPDKWDEPKLNVNFIGKENRENGKFNDW